MPSQKISAMPAAGTLDGTELLPIIQAAINKRTTTGDVGFLYFGVPIFRGVPYWDGTVLAWDPQVTITPGGVLNAEDVRCSKLISTGAAGCGMDISGVLTGSELHAQNGFNGTGAFTNFTIEDGVITNAF